MRLSAFWLWAVLVLAAPAASMAWQPDDGDGTYTNPPIYADFPDPDIIRVGSDFYMVSTTFAQSPGINVLHSQDLVSWEYVSHVADTLDGGSRYNLEGGSAYSAGLWAPSIRYHRGAFYVAVNPHFANGRIYYATDIAGPWKCHQLDRPTYDPGLFIDDDGTGYIVCGSHSLTLLTLNADFSEVVSQRDGFLETGAEGSHVVKRGDYYYVFNAKPSVWPYQLLVSRSRSIAGPYETRECLNELTGGHQGAILEMADGTWYGFVMQDHGAIGRMTYISPVFWRDDWPVWGTPEAPGRVPREARKPVQGMPALRLAASDEFDSAKLGLQWLWNHNPDSARWSLTERPGFLRLRPMQADGFWRARNTLTQKAQGPKSSAVVKLDVSSLQPGDIAGFGTLGKNNGHITISADENGERFLAMEVVITNGGGEALDRRVDSVPYGEQTIYLRTDVDFETSRAACSYSREGDDWTTLGGTFSLEWGSTFQGTQFAVFCYNRDTDDSSGHADVDSFTLSDSAELAVTARGRPVLNGEGTTFVADNGHLLRGPFVSTEWGPPPPDDNYGLAKARGCNAIHLYAECFDMNYPAAGSTAPGYAVERIDRVVKTTRELGMYLVITIGNGANNGKYNYDYIMDFWEFYAPRYKDEAHVIYEIQNEPVAWSPPYQDEVLKMELDAYSLIRSHAPDTPVLLFSYSVLGKGEDALKDLEAIGDAIDWRNACVAFHGYAGHEATTASLEKVLAAGYPCFMTEFCAADWGSSPHVLDAELVAQLERLEVSWLAFLLITRGIGPDFRPPGAFRDVVLKAGLSWMPDFGDWPPPRGVYGNDGQPRATPRTWNSEFLVGTLRIEVEDYDVGGEGVAYHDGNRGNTGGVYRPLQGVDLKPTDDAGGGFAAGWMADGEWLEYTIFVKEPGYYDLSLRHASPDDGRVVRVFCNGSDVTGAWALPSTGGWTVWKTAVQTVFLEYGRQKLRLEIEKGFLDLNWIELTPTATGSLADGIYKLVNRNSGRAMEGVAEGNKVVQDAYAGTAAQRWRLQHLGANQYKATCRLERDSEAENRYWSVFYTNEARPLDFVPWWGIDARNQRFILVPLDGGFYRIRPAKGGMTLGVQGASLDKGAPVQQFEFSGSGHQQWAVLPPAAPGFPTNLVAKASSRTQVDLAWAAVDGAEGYNVRRSPMPGGPYATIANVALPEYRDTGHPAGKPCYYVVSAVVGGTEGLSSAEAKPSFVVLHLTFEEADGVTVADAGGSGRAAHLVDGARLVAHEGVDAVSLDGEQAHVALPPGIASGLSDFTVAAWIKLTDLRTWSRIFDFGSGTDNYMFLTASNAGDGVPQFAIRTAETDEQKVRGTAPLPTGKWTHVAVTLSGSLGTLYVNGEAVGRNSGITLTPARLGETRANFIGRSQFPADAYLAGLVGDFRVYDAALNSGAIARLAMSSPDSGGGRE